jgi:adenine deaminase
MSILIREGSAAKNFAALHSLIDSNPDRCMFCSDDKHPDDLVKGHINDLARRSVALGHDVLSVLQIACLNPVRHYALRVGLLQIGDPADCILVEDLHEFRVLQTYCRGQLVAKDGEALLPTVPVTPINRFVATAKAPSDLFLPDNGKPVRVIEAIDGQVTTSELQVPASVRQGEIIADLTRDIRLNWK